MAGDYEKSIKYHEQLWRYFSKIGDWESSISHLKQIYQFFIKENRHDAAHEIANQLGIMYYKLGEKEKSAEFYKIAQRI